jgi:hypothetical protein
LGALVDAPAVYRVLVWNVDRADAKPHTSVGLGDAVGVNGVGVVELGRGLRGGEAGKGSDAEDDGGVHGGGWGWTVECRGSDVGEAVYVWSAVMFRACGLECTHHARVHEKKKVKVLQDGSR